MSMSDKTRVDLLVEIRHTAWAVGSGSEKIPMDRDCLLRLQGQSQQLANLCAVLRGRLEATQATQQEGE
jgi:hypothetical protein